MPGTHLRARTSPMKRTPRFSRTMPSDAAKKARIVGDEVLLVVGESLPVLHVVAQVDLLGCDFTGKRALATTVFAPRTRRKTGRARVVATARVRGKRDERV